MKIAIVNSHPAAVEAIRHVLASTGRHQVAWVAGDGAEAVEKCARNRPDLILMDMVMPVLNGVEATRLIMAKSPCAILVVTATVSGSTSKVFEALGAGAIDAINTPEIDADAPDIPAALLKKIDMVEKLIFRETRGKTVRLPSVRPKAAADRENRLVVVGASAGGPSALAEVLKGLPANFPAAIIIVQHVDSKFAAGLAEWLNGQSTLPVRVAREGEKPARGTVLVAGKNDHLAFVDDVTLGYTPNPVDYVYRPSVDVLFKSVAKHWKGEAVGVLLTGMGHDGAQGLKILRNAGCHTIVQDKATCLVYGMPKAAVALEAADEILPLHQIGLTLRKIYAS